MRYIILLVIVKYVFAGYGYGYGFGGGFGGIIGETTRNFDAKDVNRDDLNISTKIVSKEFNLTITTNISFSGTVYSVLQDGDKNISDINKSTWNDETEKDITITFEKTKNISKNAHVYIKWESDEEEGESNSTDNLAVIPLKYTAPSTIKAGEKIDVIAVDNDSETTEYSQTLDSNTTDKNATLIYNHRNGNIENIDISIKFNNGIGDLKINDVGIYTLELNDTNFAEVDKDDTNEANRTIFLEQNITVTPYKFKTAVVSSKTNTGRKWLYESKEFNYTIEANITSLSKDNNITKNFDKDEYSSDVNMTLKLIAQKFWNEEVNLSYFIDKENNLTLNNRNYEINFTINKNNFTNGKSDFSINMYIYKNISVPNSPIDINILDLNSTDKNIIVNEGEIIDDNISFYYSKIHIEDIFTTLKDSNTTLNIVVFDKNKTDAKNRFDDLILIDWYLNKYDDISDIIDMNMTQTIDLDNSIDINVTHNLINSGNIIINIDNNISIGYGILHINIKPYLWYSKYNDNYKYENSNCLHHYCIEYKYQSDLIKDSIGSGVFIGAEVNNTLEFNGTKKGIKVFR